MNRLHESLQVHAKKPLKARKMTATLVFGALLLCLALFLLSGCCKTRYVTTPAPQISPPAILLQDTPAPCLPGQTNLDLLFYTQDLELALQRANTDKAALRNYFKALQQNN